MASALKKTIDKDTLKTCLGDENAAKFGHCSAMEPDRVKELYKCVHGASPKGMEEDAMCNAIDKETHQKFVRVPTVRNFWRGTNDTGVHNAFFLNPPEIKGETMRDCAKNNNIQLGENCYNLTDDNLKTLYWCVFGAYPDGKSRKDICQDLKAEAYEPFPPVTIVEDEMYGVEPTDNRGVSKDYWTETVDLIDDITSAPGAAAAPRPTAAAASSLPAASDSLVKDILALFGGECTTTGDCADGLKCHKGMCLKKGKPMPYGSNSKCFGRDELCKKGLVCRDTGRCGQPPKGSAGGKRGTGGIRPGSDCMSGACPGTALECRKGKCRYPEPDATAMFGTPGYPARPATSGKPLCDGNLVVSAAGNCVYPKRDATATFGTHRHPSRPGETYCDGDLVVSAAGNCVYPKPAEPKFAGWRKYCATKECEGNLTCSANKRCVPRP